MKENIDVIVIPTYNEKENIVGMITDLRESYPDMEVWVVDDSSPDGTGDLVRKLSDKDSMVKFFSRPIKNGLGNAYKFIHTKIQYDQSVRYVVTMDADRSHPYASVRDLVQALRQYDLAIGSRYVKGGKIVGWSLRRLLLSYLGNIYTRIVSGLKIKDCTAGFVAFRRSMIDGIDFGKFSGASYAYQIEFKNAILKQGARYIELPITFTERRVGKSKMSFPIIVEGLLMPWKILSK